MEAFSKSCNSCDLFFQVSVKLIKSYWLHKHLIEKIILNEQIIFVMRNYEKKLLTWRITEWLLVGLKSCLPWRRREELESWIGFIIYSHIMIVTNWPCINFWPLKRVTIKRMMVINGRLTRNLIQNYMMKYKFHISVGNKSFLTTTWTHFNVLCPKLSAQIFLYDRGE